MREKLPNIGTEKAPVYRRACRKWRQPTIGDAVRVTLPTAPAVPAAK